MKNENDKGKLRKFLGLKNSLKKEICSFLRFSLVMANLQYINKEFKKYISSFPLVEHIKNNKQELIKSFINNKTSIFNFNKLSFENHIQTVDDLEPSFYLMALINRNKKFFKVEDYRTKENEKYNFICFSKSIEHIIIYFKGKKEDYNGEKPHKENNLMKILGKILHHNKKIHTLHFNDYFSGKNINDLKTLKYFLNEKNKNQVISLKFICNMLGADRECMGEIKDLLVNNNFVKYLELQCVFHCYNTLIEDGYVESFDDSFGYFGEDDENSDEFIEESINQDNDENGMQKRNKFGTENENRDCLDYDSEDKFMDKNIYCFDILRDIFIINKSITHLNLHHSCLGFSKKYISIFKEMMEKNNTLTHINLGSLQFDLKRKENYMNLVKDVILMNKNLREICLTLNDIWSDPTYFIGIISEVIKGLEHLEELSLNNLSLKFNPIAILSINESLNKQNNLISLNLSKIAHDFNQESDYSMLIGVIEGLMQNHLNLKKFYFRKNRLGESFKQFFGQFMKIMNNSKIFGGIIFK